MKNRNRIRSTPYPANIRIGFGFDSHRLRRGRRLILGGLLIPSPKGLLGHSDGDLLSHSIGDALLGAAGLKDIGTHFPDTDPKYKDISSLLILSEIRKLIKKQRYQIINVDTTIILDNPKLTPYIDNMKKTLSKVLRIPVSRIGIKAKTAEGFGKDFKTRAISFAVAVIKRDAK